MAAGQRRVTRRQVAHPQDLAMRLGINGRRMQTGSARTMIFSVAKIVSFIIKFRTLESGVGMGMKPTVGLQAGDVMARGVDILSEQRRVVVAFQG